MIRARFRGSFEEPKLIEPCEIYENTIELQLTSNLLKVGHRIRLDVSSSDFPNFDRNHNKGAEDYEDTALIPATQTIYHDRRHPSKVILPIIPSEKGEA